MRYLHGCYYGVGEVRGKQTYVACLLGPIRIAAIPMEWLVIDTVVPVEGHMVVQVLHRGDRPIRAYGVSYDASPEPPGEWRGRLTGSWPARLKPLRRRSIWDRLRMMLKDGRGSHRLGGPSFDSGS